MAWGQPRLTEKQEQERVEFEKTRSSEYRNTIIRYKKVFTSEEGARVLEEMKIKYHWFSTHGGDPFKEGQRSVMCDLDAFINSHMEDVDKKLRG